jgi:hypothetical protein
MNRLNQIARRLIPAAAAAGVTTILFSAVVTIGEPQRSQTIATNMLVRQPAVAVAAESRTPPAVLTVALADDQR